MFKSFSVFIVALCFFVPYSFSQSNNYGGVLLYAQTDIAGNEISLPSYLSYNTDWTQIADDFTATSSWEIDKVVIVGMDADTSYVGFNVNIYTNNSGFPGTLVYSAETQPYTISYITPFIWYITINLGMPATLISGDYFISIQSSSEGGNCLYWTQTESAYGRTTLFRSGCTSWVPVTSGICLPRSNTDMYFELYGSSLTSVESEIDQPINFVLSQNYPNPFNPSTKISWLTPISSHQTLKVYDVLGNEVATLVDENKSAGNYEVEFNASNLPSGIYFYQLKAGDFIQTNKMILIK